MIQYLRRALTRHARPPSREPAADWRETVRQRLFAGAVVIAVWALAIQGRLVYLQVIAHEELVASAERQQQEQQITPAKRGEILDRRGRVLATSADADTVYVNPSVIGEANHKTAVARLCEALGDCTARDREAMADRFRRGKYYANVRRKVRPDQAERIAALGLEGVGFRKESRRWYPNQSLAAHVLGYVGVDNTGLAGVEYAYESHIRGEDGRVLIHTDAHHRAFDTRVESQPTEGWRLQLTIDQTLQYIAERELRAGVEAHRAQSGSAIVMDPRTGELLALASYPTFNPNRFSDADDRQLVNRAVQAAYEPGSTFKIVTASSAIEEQLMSPDTLIDTSPGTFRVGDRVIREYRGHNYQLLSFTEVLAKSSNVGAIKIGFKVGTERLSRYVDRFGFGKPVLEGQLPGESSGIVWRPEQWTDGALASVSMGYQVSVTPLQMAAAVSSIANGGEYLRPRIVRSMERNGQRVSSSLAVLRRTVTKDTAATLTTIMEAVVTDGTAKAAQIPGYTIAGKTGTAEMLINGRYSPYLNHASFAGFLPSRNPALTIVVVVDAPRANGTSGGVVAAPIFKAIAQAAMRYLGVPPDLNPVDPVLVARHSSMPVPRPLIAPEHAQPAVTFVADGAPGSMPDLFGLSAREATRRLAAVGMSAQLIGDGFVTAQRPAPGTAIEAGDVGRLTLRRARPAAPAPAVQP